MKFKMTFGFKGEVTFLNEELAKAFFIEGDWSRYFTQYNALGELSEDILRGVFFYQNLGEAWVEGFGVFKYEYDKRLWELEKPEFGKIIVELDALDILEPAMETSK